MADVLVVLRDRAAKSVVTFGALLKAFKLKVGRMKQRILSLLAC